MTLALCVATMQPEATFWENPYVLSLMGKRTELGFTLPRFNTPEDNLGVVGSYQWLYETSATRSDILAYIHDDVEVFENWDDRVLAEFADPKVGIVGFGGAKRHGHPNLYKTPYRVEQLARFGYVSNTRDAEVHGERFAGSTEVAVLDGFSLCCRREFLDRVGGWSLLVENAPYWNYDYAICALARRHGYRIRMVGIDCHHYGGRTSVDLNLGQEAFEKAHRWYYEEFRDTMPFEVTT